MRSRKIVHKVGVGVHGRAIAASRRGRRNDVELQGSQLTLLITLYAKALDNRTAKPLLRDELADEVVRRIDYDFSRFQLNAGQISGLALRAKVLDDWAREWLAQHPDTIVLHLGCGLDTRVFRINPRSDLDWIDIDYPDVIQLRRELLPERYGSYRMLAMDVSDPDWLAPIAGGRPALIISEGLFPYLSESAARALVQRVIDRFPRGQWLCDIYSRLALRLLQRSWVARSTGARFGDWGFDDPREMEEWHPRLAFVDEPRLHERAGLAGLPAGQRWLYSVYDRWAWLRRLGRLARYRF
ncbi:MULTISPECIES: class I SAM-dependent methyltransferase [unclassified Lysobacter]|uniref:class I SAM-dependent methyltransferase n=1 Tax=unclassified Lysobacter TaxID=2635362 RepID=UPI0009EA9D89|nr:MULTISPECIES: class I SAM-dependent methyltransferase [unclassified Lysobacter]